MAVDQLKNRILEMRKPAWASPRGLVCSCVSLARLGQRIVKAKQKEANQYSFLGSCMLRTRL